jgi:hypothetical protein
MASLENANPAHGAHNVNSEFGLQLDSKTGLKKVARL